MRTRLLIAAPLTTCVLLLAGCGSDDVKAPEYRGDSGASAPATADGASPAEESSPAAEATPEPSPSAEPEPETASPTAEPEAPADQGPGAPSAEAKQAYLNDLRNMGFDLGGDAKALGIGNKVCADLRSGKSFTAAADGADGDRARGAQIAGSAVTFLCPDQISKITGT